MFRSNPVFPAPHQRLRRGRILLSLLAVSLTLAACGSSEDSASTGSVPDSEAVSESESESPPQTTPAAEAAFPVTIEHKFGSTEITEKPERVLSLGFNEHDAILAYGVKPIALRYWFDDESDVIFPWAEDEFTSAQGPEDDPEILNMPSTELNFEKIAALQPDLISGLYSGMDEDDYAKLSQIAPTIAQSGEYVDYGMPWQEVTQTVGRALGQGERGDELVAEVEAQFVAAREEHPDLIGKTVALASAATDGQYYFFASQDGRTRIFTQLGLEVPDELDEIAGEEFFGTISGEQLNLLDRDVLIWLLGEGESQVGIEESPLFNQLNVVQENRAVFVGDVLNDALNFGTVLSLPFLLDGVVPMLAAAA